jgi:hypothetical protein
MKRKLIKRNKQKLTKMYQWAVACDLPLDAAIAIKRQLAGIKASDRVARKAEEFLDYDNVKESCLGLSVPVKYKKRNGRIYDPELFVIKEIKENE